MSSLCGAAGSVEPREEGEEGAGRNTALVEGGVYL